MKKFKSNKASFKMFWIAIEKRTCKNLLVALNVLVQTAPLFPLAFTQPSDSFNSAFFEANEVRRPFLHKYFSLFKYSLSVEKSPVELTLSSVVFEPILGLKITVASFVLSILCVVRFALIS